MIRDYPISTVQPGLSHKLFCTKGGCLVLTCLGEFKLARAMAVDQKVVHVSKLIDFGQTPLEKWLIGFLGDKHPAIRLRCGDPLKALFLLRVIHIPENCFRLICGIAKHDPTELYWLGPVATYVIALVRTLCERKYRSRAQSRGSLVEISKWKKRFAKPVVDWFDDAPEGYLFWMSRFDQWRTYAEKSWRYWIEKQSLDARRLEGGMKEAAVLGVLRRMDSLPLTFFADWEARILGSLESSQVFRRNARKSRYNVTMPNVELNTWLIELWPLVLEYGWSFRDIQRVATRKFENLDPGVIENTKDLKKHCKRLGLRLRYERKIGRPRKMQEGSHELPLMAAFAISIEELGSDPEVWVLGNTTLPIVKT